jgi:hypothetical protein
MAQLKASSKLYPCLNNQVPSAASRSAPFLSECWGTSSLLHRDGRRQLEEPLRLLAESHFPESLTLPFRGVSLAVSCTCWSHRCT